MLVPQGEFELGCNPPDDNRQAWDSADEFLLNHIDDLQDADVHSSFLILNDACGALAVALADAPVYSWSDSFVAQQALRDNLAANGYPAKQIETNSGTDFPAMKVDRVLIKIPKALALLEHQLYALRPVLHHGTHIVAAGMSRHIHSSTLELFENILGPVTTTRARKKSRLIRVARNHSINEGQSRFPETYELEVGRVFRIANHAGLFSQDRLDPGSRLLIEHIPVGDQYRRIVDLGCGNGVLGIIAASVNPEASLLFCDESYMAIASACENFRSAFAQTRCVEFKTDDALQSVASDSRDLVLINPPFHQQHSIGDAIAWKMFMDARRVLVAGGELRLVGNRNLGYHAKLMKLFGNCETIHASRKFVILSSVRRA